MEEMILPGPSGSIKRIFSGASVIGFFSRQMFCFHNIRLRFLKFWKIFAKLNVEGGSVKEAE